MKTGASLATDNNIIYMIKGNGSTALWKYTPGVGWSSRVKDTIPNWGKMKGVKNGAALTYLDGKLYLLKGNKTRQFWCYVPTADKSEERIANNAQTVNASQSEAFTHLSSTLDVSPNPLTKLTTIHYTIPVSGQVSLKLYNATGQLIKTLANEYQNTGSYTLDIDNWSLHISSGIYFLKFEIKTDTKEIKLIIE
jgi:hypothetical protein